MVRGVNVTNCTSEWQIKSKAEATVISHPQKKKKSFQLLDRFLANKQKITITGGKKGCLELPMSLNNVFAKMIFKR